MTPTQNAKVLGCNMIILVASGVDLDAIVAVRSTLKESGITTLVVASHPGAIKSAQGIPVVVDCSLPLDESLQFDAVFIPGGTGVERLSADENALMFIRKAYKNGKVISSSDGGERLVIKSAQSAQLPNGAFIGEGVINHSDNDTHFFRRLIDAIAQRNSFNRPDIDLISG